MLAHTGVLHSRFQLHFRRPKNKKNRSPHEVVGKIKWKQPVLPAQEEEAESIEPARDVSLSCFCQPERRLPSGTKRSEVCPRDKDWHPFWHIRRSHEAGTCNSAIVGLELKVITSSAMRELQAADKKPPNGLWDYFVTVPCIVNTKQIEKAEEIVLKWETIEGGGTNPKTAPKKKVFNAFTLGTAKKNENVIKWSFRGAGLADG